MPRSLPHRMSSTDPFVLMWHEMDVPAGSSREQDVANHHDLFGLGRDALETEARADDAFVHRAARGERRLLAVVGDGDAERARVLERRAHEVRARDRTAVVAHRHGARTDHLAELGERLPFLA